MSQDIRRLNMKKDIKDRLGRLLKQGKYTSYEIINLLNISHRDLGKAIRSLENNNINILYDKNDHNQKQFYISKIPLYSNKKTIISTGELDGQPIKRMHISDTHLGCHVDNLEKLNEAYDIAVENRINVVYHTGD